MTVFPNKITSVGWRLGLPVFLGSKGRYDLNHGKRIFKTWCPLVNGSKALRVCSYSASRTRGVNIIQLIWPRGQHLTLAPHWCLSSERQGSPTRNPRSLWGWTSGNVLPSLVLFFLFPVVSYAKPRMYFVDIILQILEGSESFSSSNGSTSSHLYVLSKK